MYWNKRHESELPPSPGLRRADRSGGVLHSHAIRLGTNAPCRQRWKVTGQFVVKTYWFQTSPRLRMLSVTGPVHKGFQERTQ